MLNDGLNITKFLIPGDLYVSTDPAVFKTVLGSCIALCVHDSRLKSGGMNHFIYAESNGKSGSDSYGDISCENLIQKMITSGSRKKDLTVRIFGGASSFIRTPIYSPGNNNIRIAKKIINNWRIPVIEEDLGGCFGRTIVFSTDSDRIILKKLTSCMGSCPSDKKCDKNNQ